MMYFPPLQKGKPLAYNNNNSSGGCRAFHASNSNNNDKSNSNNNNDKSINMMTVIKKEKEQWRSMVDNCIIEFMSSLFVNLATIMCWDWSGDKQSLQYIPAIVLGLVLMCLKDEDYFFPDATHTVTLVVWALGGYHTWIQPCARLCGQTLGFAASIWICSFATLPHVVIHVQHPLSIVFVLEIIGTALEHMAVVYVILPLLPPENSHGAKFKFPKVKPKSHEDTVAPSNKSVMHAAITFTGVHFCLWRSLNVEMNPAITLLIAYVRCLQEGSNSNISSGHGGKEEALGIITPWSHATMGLWGQAVGLLVCIVYTVLYIPREAKYWPATFK